jgi:hypothetical protein
MAITVERRRPSLSNKPALGGRSGYEAGDARIPITAPAPRPDTFALTAKGPANLILAERGRVLLRSWLVALAGAG